MVDLLYSILGFVVAISIIVFVHEFGHYYVARLCGVRVEIFSIGFGPAIYKWKGRLGTEFRISVLPLGGYVKMFGEQNISGAPDVVALSNMSEECKSQSFYHKPLLQKAFVVAAGPVFNYLLAIFFIAGLFLFYGKVATSSKVAKVNEGSIAEFIGLQKGDVIVAVDGSKIDNVFDIKRSINDVGGAENLKLDILRNEVFYSYDVKQSLKVANKENFHSMVLGVNFEAYVKKLGAIDAIFDAIYDSYSISFDMLGALFRLIACGNGMENVGGPIKIAQHSGISMKQGFASYIWFMALISLNLALVNLLPIPMLDGGHLLYYFIEYIMGKPLQHNVQKIGYVFGFVLLISLMFFATFNDIRNLLR